MSRITERCASSRGASVHHSTITRDTRTSLRFILSTLPLTRSESVSRYYPVQPVVIALARMVLWRSKLRQTGYCVFSDQSRGEISCLTDFLAGYSATLVS